jgi:hypothetical protein
VRAVDARDTMGDGAPGGLTPESFRRLHAPEPKAHRRLVRLTSEQIALLQATLAYWERAIADTSYDPQVQEWARTHRTETGASVAAIRKALAASSPETDW